eukprot:scaffold115596_cov36-Phaeocystis_antarctica.AAC.1
MSKTPGAAASASAAGVISGVAEGVAEAAAAPASAVPVATASTAPSGAARWRSSSSSGATWCRVRAGARVGVSRLRGSNTCRDQEINLACRGDGQSNMLQTGCTSSVGATP